MWDPLFVRVGQEITKSLWDALVARVRSVHLIEGPGIRLQYTADGTIVTATAADGSNFAHPFRVAIAGDRLTIRPGLVNGVDATIKGVPLAGDAKNPPPFLDFKALKLDKERRGYVALEIKCGPDWQITKGAAEVVQVAAWDTETGEPGEAPARGPAGVPGLSGRRVRYPLALLRPNAAGALEVFQIQHFNLAHEAKPRDAKSNIARHFFKMGGAA
ncbi:hypothetical protein ACXR0O_19210 [Verrucomicrobiota bacterium sgz303538]